jgi:uncharacterized protein
MTRVVLDTNVLVSASLRPNSVPDRAYTLALARFELCASDEMFRELEEVLRREKFDAYVGFSSRMRFFQVFRATSFWHWRWMRRLT